MNIFHFYCYVENNDSLLAYMYLKWKVLYEEIREIKKTLNRQFNTLMSFLWQNASVKDG